MVREAKRAGLRFDPDKMEEMNCGWDVSYDDEPDHEHVGPMDRHGTVPEVQITSTGDPEITKDRDLPRDARKQRDDEHHAKRKRFHDHLHKAATQSTLHDALTFGKGLPTGSVATWKFMEWLPFRRMDLQDDGSWKPINWPLPRGEVRDIPDTAWIHSSAIRRMEVDESYRPGNLIVGGGGRGVIRAPKEAGLGEWEIVHEKGDPVGECVVRIRRGENGEKIVAGAVRESNGAQKGVNEKEVN